MSTEQFIQPTVPQVVIALDLGGTKLASCLFTEDGQLQMPRMEVLGGRQSHEIGEFIISEIRRLQKAAVQLGRPVSAVGISVPGIVDARTSRIWAPNIPGWDDYPLVDDIRAALPDETVRIAVDSDRSAYILGEAWQGAAEGCQNAVFLAVGTGIGAGIISDGRVLQGAHGIAGAVGWLALDRPFYPEYVTCGCFESHASGEGLAKQLAAALLSRPEYRGILRKPEGANARDLFAAYEGGDEVATHVINEAIAYWGMACANLVSLLDTEKIIFGGGVFGPATRFLDDIANEARRWAQPISMSRVKFEASRLGGDAGLYGAGHLALFGSQLQKRTSTDGVLE